MEHASGAEVCDVHMIILLCPIIYLTKSPTATYSFVLLGKRRAYLHFNR